MFDHIGGLPEVVEYSNPPCPRHEWQGWVFVETKYADAALAAADREVGRLKACGEEALRAYSAYTREMLDPASSAESRWAAADRKNEALSCWEGNHE